MRSRVSSPTLWFLLGALASAPGAVASPLSDAPPPLLDVILEKGDTLSAIGVEPAPFDMVRVTSPNGEYRYLPTVRVRAVMDVWGEDRFKDVVQDREKIGRQFPDALSPRNPGLRVGPRSVTKSFAITEATLLTRLGHGASHYSLQGYFGFDLGVMHNVGERIAVGGTAFIGSGDDYANVGARLRVRRWLSRTASLDIAPGIILLEHRLSGGNARPAGFSTQVSLNPSRYISVTADVFSLRRHGYRYDAFRGYSIGDVRDTGVMVGGRVGQWPGAVVGMVALLSGLFMSSTIAIQ